MIKKQTNSNRSEKIASKVQSLVAEILQREFSDDDLIRGVSLVGSESRGGMQFVKLFFYSRARRINQFKERSILYRGRTIIV